MGQWNSSSSYAIGDMVRHDPSGASYEAIAVNNNLPPNSNPAQWTQMVTDGGIGPTGVAGPTGPAGATGNSGIGPWQVFGSWSAQWSYAACYFRTINFGGHLQMAGYIRPASQINSQTKVVINTLPVGYRPTGPYTRWVTVGAKADTTGPPPANYNAGATVGGVVFFDGTSGVMEVVLNTGIGANMGYIWLDFITHLDGTL
jgi:hypothetical protein